MNVKIINSIVLALILILVTQSLYIPIFNSFLSVLALILLFRNLKLNGKRTSKVITFSFVILSLVSIFYSFKTFLGIEAGVAILSTFLFAKALETSDKRDLIILFNFALFVSASSFLYNQSIWMTLLVIICLLACFVGFYRIQTSEFPAEQFNRNHLISDVRHVGKFILLAVPFFIVLFLFFPRLPPLWHIPIPDDTKGVTGISDTMSPGDISKLSQSSELAFRILGNMRELPDRSELYWRALVLDQYDGQQWTSNFSNTQPTNIDQVENNNKYFEYQYLASDARTKWVISLDKSIPLQEKYDLRSDWSVVPKRQVAQIQPIKMRWIGDANFKGIDGNIPAWVESINLKVPNQYDQNAQKFAREFFVKSQNNPEIYIQNILSWYKANNFVYTLNPELLGENRVDEFLFKTREGFCEHYASSFVMLLRYVGIPARIVVGYQGGQLAPDKESWEVRQLDAHAWAEVLLKDKWVRFDPTSIIAPNRIDNGMQSLITSNQQVLGSENTTWNYQKLNLITKIRIWGDYFTYQWQSKVIGYDVEAQRNWFNKLGFTHRYSSILAILFLIGSLIVIYFLVVKYVQFKKKDLIISKLNKLSDSLPLDMRKHSFETFQTWLTRISLEFIEDDRAVIFQTVRMYDEFKFSNNSSIKEKEILSWIEKCSIVIKKNRKILS